MVSRVSSVNKHVGYSIPSIYPSILLVFDESRESVGLRVYVLLLVDFVSSMCRGTRSVWREGVIDVLFSSLFAGGGAGSVCSRRAALLGVPPLGSCFGSLVGSLVFSRSNTNLHPAHHDPSIQQLVVCLQNNGSRAWWKVAVLSCALCDLCSPVAGVSRCVCARRPYPPSLARAGVLLVISRSFTNSHPVHHDPSSRNSSSACIREASSAQREGGVMPPIVFSSSSAEDRVVCVRGGRPCFLPSLLCPFFAFVRSSCWHFHFSRDDFSVDDPSAQQLVVLPADQWFAAQAACSGEVFCCCFFLVVHRVTGLLCVFRTGGLTSFPRARCFVDIAGIIFGPSYFPHGT